MTREELIAKVEGLTENSPDAERNLIDEEVHTLVYGPMQILDTELLPHRPPRQQWPVGDRRWQNNPECFTGSVDAVLALIRERLPRWSWHIYTGNQKHKYGAFLGGPIWSGQAYAAIPSAALLAAYLRADAATPAAREGEEAHG